MKAQKCLGCGYLDEIKEADEVCLRYCPECYSDFGDALDLIDWEKELMPEKYDYVIGA